MDSQSVKNQQKAFPTKHFIEINDAFAIRGKTFQFFRVRANTHVKFEEFPSLFKGGSLGVNSGTFAMKITEVTEFWFKSSLKLFVKSKSTSENIIYRVVAIVLVL